MNVTEKRMIKPHKSGKKRWELLECDCDTNPNCQRCKFEEAEESIPKADFTVKKPVDPMDPNGPQNEKVVKTVKVIRGSMDDVIGWVF